MKKKQTLEEIIIEDWDRLGEDFHGMNDDAFAGYVTALVLVNYSSKMSIALDDTFSIVKRLIAEKKI